MSRGISKKLSSELPENYSAQWLERMDKRSKIWRAVSERIAALESDAGGSASLSHAKRSIIRRAVFLELLTETQEMKFAGGEAADVGAYTQSLNSMLGCYRAIGIERKARNGESIQEYLAKAVAAA